MKHLFTPIVLVLFMCSQIVAQNNIKVQNKVQRLINEGATVPVLITFKNQQLKHHIPTNATKPERARMVYDGLQANAIIQEPVAAYFTNERKAYKPLYIANAIAADITQTELQELKKFSSIVEITYDEEIFVEQPITNKSIAKDSALITYGLKMVNADKVWDMGYTGNGVVVGGQDTGYDWNVKDIKPKYRGYQNDTLADHNYSWHDAIYEADPNNDGEFSGAFDNPCGFQTMEPCDDNDHGTHTMGTMVGSTDSINIGVAPGAKWIGCRSMERGWGKLSTYLECFQWFLAPTDLNGENPRPDLAPHVINNSWSCPPEEGCSLENWNALRDAVNNLKAAGVVVVVSAGNSGPDCGSISTPAPIFEHSFTVGATNAADTIANFSSRGVITADSSFRTKPNISAPGARVLSVITGGEYAKFSGTSMAGPHVAGIVALIINANPALAGRVDVIEDIIEQTAVAKYTTQDCGDALGSEIPNAAFGYGRIDALAAVERALAYDPVSTDDIKVKDTYIYPNPIVSSAYISSTNEIDMIHVRALDGKEVLSFVGNGKQTTVDLSSLPRGVYLMEVITNKKSYTEKIIKS